MAANTADEARSPHGPRAVWARLQDRGRHLYHAAEVSFWALRRRRPSLDHVVRAAERYRDQHGSQLASAVTYYAFLSFFPLVALAFALVGYVSFAHVEIRDYLDAAISDALPGLAGQLPMDAVERARTGAGIVGLLGLVYSGLGVMSAWREALHAIWLKDVAQGPNLLLAKLIDAAAILVIGIALIGSVALTGVAQTATHWLLGALGLDGAAAAAPTRLLGAAIAVAADTLIFLVLFDKLSGTRRPVRLLWRGALLAAVGFEALKLSAALLLRSTLDNPIYASFAVLVGLLLWINIVSRYVLFAAAWTATWLPAGYGADPAGSSAAGDAAAGGAAAGGAAAADPADPPDSADPAAPRRGRVGPAVAAAGLALIGYALWRRFRRDPQPQ